MNATAPSRSSAGTVPAPRPGTTPVGLSGPHPVLDVVIPVYNEETDLEPCIRRLHAHLEEHVTYPYRITIADNASTDETLHVAERLAREIPEVVVHHLDEKGRGRALRAVWSTSDASVLAYMDVDLSTDLAALAPLVAPLLSGHSDLAIGSRLARGARVVRGPKREFISRCYNLILKGTLAAKFSDAQCGFKAIRGDVARRLLPHVQDTGWFFDTELLVLAQRSGLRIHEVPVDWVDDPDSSVNIIATATADLKGVARLTRATFTGEVPISRLREQLGRGHRRRGAGGAAEPGASAGAVRRRRRRQHRRVPAAVPVAARRSRLAGRELHRAARHRDRQHRRQPPGHLRRARADRRRAAPVRGPDRVRPRSAADQRFAGSAQRDHPPRAGPGNHCARAGEPGRHGAPLPVAARLGLQPRRGRATAEENR